MPGSFLRASSSPEDFQKQLADFMRQQFQTLGIKTAPNAESSGETTEAPKKEKRTGFEFDKKPRDVKAYLDRFVIKQEEAKKVLSVALCDHYHHVRLALDGQDQPNYTKQNILLVGPTGVGKTYLIRSMADLIGVPFVKGDATKFSETGYVGGDVEDLVRELVRRADGDVERAQYGIIYIDEVDKIAAANQHAGRDVSGRGVQTNLLKLMEETEVPVRSPQDIAGQVQAMMEMQRGRKSASVVNTKHILFIVSGAFDGLDKYVRRRLREGTIGFGASGKELEDFEWLNKATTRDFIEYGFEPEFIGRLPVRVVCHSLSEEDLFEILKTSEGSIIRQYEQTFAAYGIEAEMTDPGLRQIASLAAQEQIGARGLMTVCEKLFREFKYELPSTTIRQFKVDPDLVSNPSQALSKALAAHSRTQADQNNAELAAFARQFKLEHDLEIDFTEEASKLLISEAKQSSVNISELVAGKLKDFQFGLKLVFQNTGQRKFILDAPAIKEPDKILSQWVVASYRKEKPAN